MTEQNELLNIYQKLAKIRKPVEILQKNKAGYGYKYVTEDLILAKISGLMEKYGVSLIPNIVHGSTEMTQYSYTKTKSTKDGKIFEERVNEILIKADMEWHWVNNDDPADRIIVPWTLVGQQSDASQAFGSGLSYSARYFMLKYFNVATSDDDPDHWRSLQKEVEESENREVAKSIVGKIHTMVSEYIVNHEKDRQKICDIVAKYAKDSKGKACGNYNLITDPVVASKLLDELTPICKQGAQAEQSAD